MERKDWLARRRKGIGGSDAAAILGLSPWRTEMDVWLDKMEMGHETVDPARDFFLDLGTQLEPVIARLYERETGRKTMLPLPQIWQHPEHEMLIGSPDRFVQGELRGVELKSESDYSDNFGEPGTDEIPDHYLIQCAHYMMVTKFPKWDLALLHAGSRFAIYTVERDEQMENELREKLVAWWNEHIVGRKPPAIDGSKSWRDFLHYKFPLNIVPIEYIDERLAPLIQQLGAVKAAEKFYSDNKDKIENQLKSIIQDRDGLSSRFGKVTWKKTKDAQHLEFERAFRELVNAVDCVHPNTGTVQLAENILKQTMTTKPGVRRFLYTPPKGETIPIEDVLEGWKAYPKHLLADLKGELTDGGQHVNGGTETTNVPADAGEIQSGDITGAPETP